MDFSQLGLGSDLLAALSKLNFETPTPVQEAVIPLILGQDRDIVALAQTGTGKTAAFGLPLLEKLDLSVAAPQVLVLCPTRELCMQILSDLEGFAQQKKGVRLLAVYGGTDIRPQLTALRKGIHVIVATPGRLLDILGRGAADFSGVHNVVLDEADEMLNMGFEEDLQGILAAVPDGARTLLFSATMPHGVARIASKYMHEPEEVVVGQRNAGAANVSHEYVVVQARNRYAALRRVVDLFPDIYGIVFCRTRIETQQVADQLTADGYNAQALHGDLSQLQRDSVMQKFRARHVQLLVATDVAARGLDVDDLTHVINYTLPDELNAYTHRTGRTGRAGKEGVAVSIIHSRERQKVRQLEHLLKARFTQRPVPSGDEVVKARMIHLARRVWDYQLDSPIVDEHVKDLGKLLGSLSKEEIIRRFVALELEDRLVHYRNAPDLNDLGKAKPRVREGQNQMVDVVMNQGRVNRMTPQQLIGLVNLADRKRRVEIGRINIVPKQTYFEVPADQAQPLIDAFAQGEVEHDGRKVTVSMSATGNKARFKKNDRGQGAKRRRK